VLHEELGRGGMAVVYRASSTKPESLGRIVALKQLVPLNEFDLDFDLVRSFIEEARLATRFRHPNIAATHQLTKIDGTYVIEMEYVQGPTLLKVAHQCATVGPMPVDVVVQILIQLCEALDHVHNLCDDVGEPLKLIHRDVSLSNVIVADSGLVKLIDFGIVKGHTTHARTQAGTIKGKLGYIAPEYLAGRLDSRADLYALGVIAHELLTDRLLFQASNDLDTIANILELRVPTPSSIRPGIPLALDAIVLEALARNPDERFQTARELRDALVELQPAPNPDVVRTWVSWAFSTEATTAPPPTPQLTMQVDLESQLLRDDPDEPETIPLRVIPELPAPAPARPHPVTMPPGPQVQHWRYLVVGALALLAFIVAAAVL
jgi:eukaryotic-like serine/threonine-protein kinase